METKEIMKFIKEKFEQGICYDCQYYCDTPDGDACCFGDCIAPKCKYMVNENAN